MNKKSAYAGKLLDPRWQKKRLEILQRDNFTCQECGDKDETLHIHHFCYRGEPWDSINSDLITYCATCHFLMENAEKHFNSPVIYKISKLSTGGKILVMTGDGNNNLINYLCRYKNRFLTILAVFTENDIEIISNALKPHPIF